MSFWKKQKLLSRRQRLLSAIFFLLAFPALADSVESPFYMKDFMESVVKVRVEAQSASGDSVETFSGSGFLVKDGTGEIKVAFSFHTLNAILFGEKAEALIEYKGRPFALREGISLFPEQDLVLATPAWDQEVSEGITPLAVRDSFPKEGETAFLWGFPGHRGKLKPLMFGRREKGVFGRLSFLARTRETLEGSSGGPITDGRGEVFSMMISAASNHGEGLEEGALSRALSAGSAESCFSSLRDCVLKARGELYRKAEQGDKVARRQLLKYHSWNDIKAFERFAESVGRDNRSKLRTTERNGMSFYTSALGIDNIRKDFYNFLRSTAREDLFAQKELARLTGDPKDVQELRERSFKQAEEGDFQAQYFAAWILLEGDDLEGALKLLETASARGLQPARELIQQLQGAKSAAHNLIRQLQGVKSGPDDSDRLCLKSFRRP